MPNTRIRNLLRLSAERPFAADLVVTAVGLAALVGLSILSHSSIAEATQDKVAAPTICTFSRSAVRAESIVGQKGAARLQQLAGQVQALLASNRKSLATDMNAFNQEFALLNAAKLRSRRYDSVSAHCNARRRSSMRGFAIPAPRLRKSSTSRLAYWWTNNTPAMVAAFCCGATPYCVAIRATT